MKVVLFCHSLQSDWNHGNAHFLRGVARELIRQGHAVHAYEPADAWSKRNLLRDHGVAAIEAFQRQYPSLSYTEYHLDSLDLDRELESADLVLVHEWNHPRLVARIGRYRAQHRHLRVLFHDTHHRAITAPAEMSQYDLRHYDGLLAFGDVLRSVYLDRGWIGRAWTWHEAADTVLFRPIRDELCWDVIWVGNWGDEERTAELHEYLFDPVRDLGLSGTVYGVRYPVEARAAVRSAGLFYAGWTANFTVPDLFSTHRATVHVPRRPYVEALPGIPTIRVFEALACGIPLVSAPWQDAEGLFRVGEDFLMAQSPQHMKACLRQVCHEPQLAARLSQSGLERILSRHTCRHRAVELLAIAGCLGLSTNVGAVA